MKVAPFKLFGKNIFIAVRSPSDDLFKTLKDLMERHNLLPTFYMASNASLNKVWDRYKELSMAESSQVGGIDISGEVLRDTAKKSSICRTLKNWLWKRWKGIKSTKFPICWK